MWTTEIIQIKKLDGITYVMVNFLKDGVVVAMENFPIKYNVDSTWFKQQVKTKLDAIKAADSLASTLTLGSFDTTITVATPTQAEIEEKEWFADYEKWQRVLRAINAQVLTGNETPVVALKTKVQNNFKPSYLSKI